VVFISPPLIVAIEVAHFVEQAITILLFSAVLEKGDFDADTTRTPVELAELAIGIVELDWHTREFVLKDNAVEFIEPIKHLGNCRFHKVMT
jgi:hypothetical protein